ncbi:hypothetical protein PG993_000854 [Apiospora rasikravindrae]|uniref:SET domain-containing protein n=1 Tax=Apiospora rasikravindrae TaxID=990691 RepID=A0ABR1UA91_9PEZI
MSDLVREHRVNSNVAIRACPSPERSLGLFASHRMTKGLKILSEEPFLIDDTQQDMINSVAHEFSALPLHLQALFTRLWAGPLDLVPLMTAEHARLQREQLSVDSARLQQIVQLNSLEGAGTGCFLSPAVAAINHDCVPNSYVYYNYETGLVALHALRDIQQDEEITINYLQENLYLDAGERQQRLAN